MKMGFVRLPPRRRRRSSRNGISGGAERHGTATASALTLTVAAVRLVMPC